MISYCSLLDYKRGTILYYNGRTIGSRSDSLSSLGLIDKRRLKLTDDVGVELSSSVSFEIELVIESRFSDLIKVDRDELRFS